jgi:hypothetical protein
MNTRERFLSVMDFEKADHTLLNRADISPTLTITFILMCLGRTLGTIGAFLEN